MTNCRVPLSLLFFFFVLLFFLLAQVLDSLFLHMVLKIVDHFGFGFENPWVVLVVQPHVNFIDLQPSGPGMGVANDYPVVKPVLAKAKNVDVLWRHHWPDIFLMVCQVIFTHKPLSPIKHVIISSFHISQSPVVNFDRS